jgi:hypothetical protein
VRGCVCASMWGYSQNALTIALRACSATACRVNCASLPYSYATLLGVLPHAALNSIARRLDFDAAAQVATSRDRLRGVFGHGHLQLGLPRTGEWMEPELVRNSFVEQVAVVLLGRCALSFCSGNTNVPGSSTQPMHADADWPAKSEAEAAANGLQWPPTPTSLIVNYGVDDITAANGSTQIWPRSHTDVRAPGNTRGGTLEDSWPNAVANPVLPPIPNDIPFGAVSFRDPRLWHRGVPNTSQFPRHMIALVYKQLNSPVGKPPVLVFSSGAEGAFEASPMSRSTACKNMDFSGLSFVDGVVDHFGNPEPAEQTPVPNYRVTKELSLEKQ